MLDEALLILSQIAEEWNNGHALFIERYLADDFKYILCEGREVFGNKILNKIENWHQVLMPVFYHSRNSFINSKASASLISVNSPRISKNSLKYSAPTLLK